MIHINSVVVEFFLYNPGGIMGKIVKVHRTLYYGVERSGYETSVALTVKEYPPENNDPGEVYATDINAMYVCNNPRTKVVGLRRILEIICST